LASLERNITQTGSLTLCPSLKRTKKIWVYIDFHDLNIAYPKNEFLLPIADVMIDNTCAFKRMSFMDGFSGYNQFKMYPNDEKHMSFWTPLGVFCYTVMPFNLKNTGATYQRVMSIIFHDHLQKTVEWYVDDIAIKSREKNNHLYDLRTMFDLMQAHRLKMNPTKSYLGVSNGKVFESLSHPKEFILTSIRSKPSKICSLQRISKNLRVYKEDQPISVDSS